MRTSNLVTVICNTCKIEFAKPLCEIRRGMIKHYCCNKCRGIALGKYNRERNPMNTSEAWNSYRRIKAREKNLGKGKGKAFTKILGRHSHMVIAEEFLGRQLTKDEAVHHIDGNKLNNNYDNLMVMSKSDHAKLHANEIKFGKFAKRKGGDSNDISER